MAVIGNVGYVGTGATVETSVGKTYLSQLAGDAASATGVLNEITIRKASFAAGKIKLSVWYSEAPSHYTRIAFQEVSIPFGTGNLVVPLQAPLPITKDLLIGFYSDNVILYGDPTGLRNHVISDGDVSLITFPTIGGIGTIGLHGVIETPLTYIGNAITSRASSNWEGYTFINTDFNLLSGTITKFYYYGEAQSDVSWAPHPTDSSRYLIAHKVAIVKIFRDLGDSKWTFISESVIESDLVADFDTTSVHVLDLVTPLVAQAGDFIGVYPYNRDTLADAITSIDFDTQGQIPGTPYQSGNVSTTQLKSAWTDDGSLYPSSVGVIIPVPSQPGWEDNGRLEFEDDGELQFEADGRLNFEDQTRNQWEVD